MNNSSSETLDESKDVDKDSTSVLTSDSKISVAIENGFWVFKKRQESAEEVLFYNTDYFKRIGFPDAEVSIGKVTSDGIMKGGYYKHPEELTYPFRQFVYLIQREKRPPVKDETSSEEMSNTGKHAPGFFERLGSYGVQISKGVQSGIDRVSPYFKTTPENLTEEEKQKLQEEEKQKAELLNEEDENEKKKKEENERDNFDKDNYWIVRIPVINSEGLIPKNKYENEEEEKEMKLLESRVEKTLGKSKIGIKYEIGSRKIIMCESVKEYEPAKIEESRLPGSVMSKWHKFTKKE